MSVQNHFVLASPMTGLGVNTFTSDTPIDDTSCLLTPIEIEASFSVHALQCEPKWELDSGGFLARLQNTTIQIYTAISSTPLADAIDDAADSWTTQLTGPAFERTTSDCGSGATCIEVIEESIGDACAAFSISTASGGEINGNAVIKLNPNWSSYGSHLARLIAHELGHMLGLTDHSDCSGEESVMRDGLNCNASVGNIVTQNNAIPVNHTVYGEGPRTTCGF